MNAGLLYIKFKSPESRTSYIIYLDTMSKSLIYKEDQKLEIQKNETEMALVFNGQFYRNFINGNVHAIEFFCNT